MTDTLGKSIRSARLEIEEAINAARAALGPAHDQPLPPDLFDPPTEDDPELLAAFARPAGGIEPVVDPPPAAETGVPVWDALGSLKILSELVPAVPGGHSRLSQCVATMRGHFEKDLFPGVNPVRPADDILHPISYPRLEINQVVDRAKQVILVLLDGVEVGSGVRDVLSRELQPSSPFLEEDDRGTIGGFIDPSGPTKEKQRNDWKLNAMAEFLAALSRQPFAAVRYASRILRAVAVPESLLSADPSKNTVTFRGRPHPVSDMT